MQCVDKIIDTRVRKTQYSSMPSQTTSSNTHHQLTPLEINFNTNRTHRLNFSNSSTWVQNWLLYSRLMAINCKRKECKYVFVIPVNEPFQLRTAHRLLLATHMNFWMGQPVFPGCCWSAQCAPIFLISSLEEHLRHYLDILALDKNKKNREIVAGVQPTFGQSAGAEVVNVHDVSIQLEGDTLHRGLQLHAAVTDQHIHTAITLHQLSHHFLHAVHIAEVQYHQLWGKRLVRHKTVLVCSAICPLASIWVCVVATMTKTHTLSF